MNWRKLARDLERLAADQAGKPEGERALEKLALIRAKHPEVLEPEPARVQPRPRVVYRWTWMTTNMTTANVTTTEWIVWYA